MMKSKRRKSQEYFHQPPEKLNCAQAVLKAFQLQCDISDMEIEEYKLWGGGRAENGICGALFAAKRLIANETDKIELENIFEKEVGTVYCKLLKKNKVPCLSCVTLADNLIEERLKNQ